MKRREFLHASAAIGAVSSLPLAVRAAWSGSDTDAVFRLAYSASAESGNRFVPFEQSFCADCDSQTLRVWLDGLQRAEGGAVLGELWLSAMFDAGKAGQVPFLAWHFMHGTPSRLSQRLSFVVTRDGMRGFELEYRLLGDATCRHEACALTRFDRPLLAPGHYVLIGPQRDGRSFDPSAMHHSGNIIAPLASTRVRRDFDYLAFRVEALT